MEATTSPETYVEVLGEWPIAVGRFVLAFSSCEYWTYIYLEGLGGASVRAGLANSKLSVRRGRILQLARTRAVSEDISRDLRVALAKLGKLAKKRNLAAHNSPMAHVFENVKTGELEVRFEVRGANNPALQVTLESLAAWFRDAVTLDHELALLAGRLSKDGSR